MSKAIDFRVAVPAQYYATKEDLERAYKGYLSTYMTLYGDNMEFLEHTVDSMIQNAKEAEIEYCVLQGEWEFGSCDKLNDEVYRIATENPEMFPYYFMAINPGDNHNIANYIEENVRERGFTGVNIQGFSTGLAINDPAWTPVYSKCQELGIPVAIHCSINFATTRSLSVDRPIDISDVAAAFPDLLIVANHGGWPWVAELVACAWKHPNVYIDIGAQMPKYIAKPGTGWEPLLVHGNSTIQDKVLFASDSMLPQKELIQQMYDALPLKDSVREKWLYKNAEALLDRIKRY